MAQTSPTTRSLLEVALGFLGALLVVPLLFKTVGGVFKLGGGVLKMFFKMGVTRRLMADAAFAGVTALLTRTEVLDTLFGQKGKIGDGLLKPDPKK